MIAHFNRFVSNGAGLEKTLRLIQAVAQIAAVFTVGGTAVRLTTAKLQLALSMSWTLTSSQPHQKKQSKTYTATQRADSSASLASSAPSSVFRRCWAREAWGLYPGGSTWPSGHVSVCTLYWRI